ncbi:GT4 family glycosyltransferase PelF [Devosia albogilva]|uniref:GT4 family glycosyltransferase PelF n=1 Tax=Devosia albogilva TaxID=429726 RepID=A0ABW5QN67_9HYPH
MCLIAEGCYPYVAGGVSTWTDWLIRSQPQLNFRVLAVLPAPPAGGALYPAPPNLVGIDHVLLDTDRLGRERQWPDASPGHLALLLDRLLSEGDESAFAEVLRLTGPINRKVALEVLLNSENAWQTICAHYVTMPHADFLGFFWAWRALVGGLYRMMTCSLPAAKVYHALSTGYAGLLGARATIETARPLLITEHGIYSNERRIEILMADWIANSVDRGLDLSDDRRDIRDFWARGFESFARVAYAQATRIVSLYEANQAFQYGLGAPPQKLAIIPNGVDIDRFGSIARRAHDRPTIAFIGRVAPIKDVQTFIDVAELLYEEIPFLRALVMGPMDEDPDYAEGCRREVQRRGLEDTVEFTGPVNVRDHLGEVDLLVLTSISEALPLVVLEAGAAGIPTVATDVGACREMIEGQAGPLAGIGAGGMIAAVGAADEVASAVATLLCNRSLLARCGENMRLRVHAAYRDTAVAAAYQTLYSDCLNQNDRAVA